MKGNLDIIMAYELENTNYLIEKPEKQVYFNKKWTRSMTHYQKAKINNQLKAQKKF